MNKLARFSVTYPTTVMMLVLAILLLGYISFDRLGVDLLPDLNSPRLFVEIDAGDRPPEEMETEFVERLEAVTARGRGVENVYSVSRAGRAMITVSYVWGTDMDEAFLDLQKSIADFSQGTDADNITVSQHDPNATPIVVAVLSHPEITDLDQLRQTAEDVIRNELIRLPGVAAVDVIGARQREVEVRTDAYTLEAYGVTLDQIASAIQSNNRNMTGGSIVEMGTRYVIRGVAEFVSSDDLKDLIIAYKTPESSQSASSSTRVPVYLREVADINIVLSEPDNIVRFNGETCLALEIFKEARFNTVDAVESTRDQLEAIQKSLTGYDLQVISDQATFIRASVTEVEQTGLIGILLAVLILYVFLRRIGVTSVISISIPISIVATFNLMYFNGLTLNIMTLGGLALGAGMLVDNAIVVVENIFRHLEKGRPLHEAAILGTGEVGGAITSSTLTTIVVFLPIVYLHGAAGELFREQAWTVAYSLLSSLFVALIVIPMLCSRLLKKEVATTRSIKTIFPRYGTFLETVIQKRRTVMLGALVLVAATACLVPFVGSDFMPRANEGELRINITLPEGTSLERTAGTVAGIENLISGNFDDLLDHLYSRIGPSTSSTNEEDALTDENSASIHLVMKKDNRRDLPRLVAGLDRILADLPDIESQLIVQQTALQSTLGTTEAPLVVEIEGDELETLKTLADSVKARLLTLGDLANIETSFQEGRPEINVEIDRIVAAQFGLSVQSVASTLTDQLSGRDAGQMNLQSQYTDIILRRPDVSLTELGDIVIESPSGRRVKLDEVARLVPAVAPREIIRNNQTRIARVTAHLANDVAFDKIASHTREVLATLDIPSDYSLNITGEEQLRTESFGNLKFALLLAIILVYMVMAAQFESLLHPFVILLTIPLAGVGAVVVLFLLGMPFNVMSFIGIIMLAGIAVNDSIILVDRINQNRRAGEELVPAIVHAGQTRIRPIIMTSVTTMLALLPLTIGIGEGASLRAPMAVAVIGGLFSSTILTLIVIPAVYHLMAGRVRTEPIEDR